MGNFRPKNDAVRKPQLARITAGRDGCSPTRRLAAGALIWSAGIPPLRDRFENADMSGQFRTREALSRLAHQERRIGGAKVHTVFNVEQQYPVAGEPAGEG